jgi:hypothetical protein
MSSYRSGPLLSVACLVCAVTLLLAPSRASAELQVRCVRNWVTVTATTDDEPLGYHYSMLSVWSPTTGWQYGPWVLLHVGDTTVVVVGGSGAAGPQVRSYLGRADNLAFYEYRAYWNGSTWTYSNQWAPITQLLWWLPGAENSIITSYYERVYNGYPCYT